jgi:uncharacterized protein
MTAMSGAIDVWCNLFTDEGIRKVFTENPEVAFSMGDQWGRDHLMVPFEPDEFIDRMDEQGVERVIIPSIKMMLYRSRELISIDWQTIAKLIEKYPDRISGAFGVDPWAGLKGVKELENAVTNYGFVGAHIHPFGFNTPMNDYRFFPAYTKCAELDVPVLFQSGHSAEFMPSAHGRPILLDDIAIYFPELKLIGAHTGWPWTEELIAMAWKHPNVYIAVSGHAPKYWDKKLVQFMNARRRGIGKVMWGTDYPLIQHDEGLSQVDDLGLKDEAKEMLLRGAALQVFKFPS